MKTAFGHHSKLTKQLKQERIRNAAPKLLEALKKSREVLCGEYLINTDTGEPLYTYDDELICEIDAAIASAQGE